jgi:hypothetical protein
MMVYSCKKLKINKKIKKVIKVIEGGGIEEVLVKVVINTRNKLSH